MLSTHSYANTNKQLSQSCFSNSAIYAVPACEQLLETEDAGHKVYFQLAKLYQKQNELEMAKTTLEQALAQFHANGDRKAAKKTAEVKSNIEEEIWLQNQPREVNADSESRMTCINFSSILPGEAVDACKTYLLSHPDDKEVDKHYLIALNKTGGTDFRKVVVKKKARPKKPRKKVQPVEEPKTVVTSNSAFKSATKATPSSSRSAGSTTSAGREANIISSQGTATANQTIASGSSSSSIDEKVLSDIQNELSDLYALIDQQNKNRPQVDVDGPYVEHGKRRALVIGNANYSPNIGKLKNSVNDAQDMSAELRRLGFDVELLTDGSLEKMEKAVLHMAKITRPKDTLLFYYAGHGVAIDGENYLIPVQSSIEEAMDVKYRALNLSFVLEKLNRDKSGATIVVLDACRNNPFPVSRSAAGAGLVQAAGPSGTLIAYSTAPRQVAIDGTGRNGVYTKHLLSEIGKTNLKVEEMFKKVRVAVERETEGVQVPWENSSLKTDFYFRYSES